MSINNINNVNPLSSNIRNILANDQIRPALSSEAKDALGSFADILSDSLKTASIADSTDKASAIELLTGQSDDLSGLLLDAQKAELSLNLALQIRNKVIDAYNEIIRMQV